MAVAQIKPWFDRVLIILFMLALGLPGIVMVTGSLEKVSSGEQRRLAELPELDFSGIKSGNYQQAFNTFYQDHFGFRKEILALARSARETLFNKSISRNVIIGDNDWRFYNIDGALRDYLGAFRPSEAELTGWINALQNKLTWFGARDIEYKLIPIPGRMSAYSDLLPPRIRRHAGITRLAAFRSYLDNHLADSELVQHVIDLGPVLDPDSTKERLYFRTDTHWTHEGAYRAYVETMQAVQKSLPDLYIVPRQRLQRREDVGQGDIARASSLPADYVENVVGLDVTDPCAAGPPKPVTQFRNTEAYQARGRTLPETNGCPKRNYRAIVQHDSFGRHLKRFLNESFGEVVYMDHYDLAGMATFIDEFRPDVFLDFRVERRFHYLLQHNPGVIEDLEQAGLPVAR